MKDLFTGEFRAPLVEPSGWRRGWHFKEASGRGWWFGNELVGPFRIADPSINQSINQFIQGTMVLTHIGFAGAT